MMILDYKGGRRGEGVKNLGKSDYIRSVSPNNVICNVLSI